MIKFFNYSACNQTITVEKSGDAKEGKCIPEGSKKVPGGAPINVCAQVESCGFVERYVCKKCSQKCTAKFT